MHNSHVSILNVPDFSKHTETSLTCSHKAGTFTPLVYYTKDNKQFIRKDPFNYSYKMHSFQLLDGFLIINGSKIPLPQFTEVSTISRVALSLGFQLPQTNDEDEEIDINELPSFKELLYVLTALALKDLSLVPNSFKQNKQLKYGEVVFDVYINAVSGSGHIMANHKAMRWLNEQDTLKLKARLFDVSDSKYKVGGYSMKYTPTPLAERLLSIIFDLLKALDFKQTHIEMQPLDFTVDMQLLQQMPLRDVIILLNGCIGYDNGFIIRPTLTDDQYSRVYSVFTSIKSSTRTLLGFTNYDIGSALQTICLQLVDNPSHYPLHQELMADKNAFRQKIMFETGNDLKWAKKELSKANNLDNLPKRYKHYPTLEAYYKEAVLLREEVIQGADAIVLERAEKFAKPKFRKEWIQGKKEPEFIVDGVKETSLFFFIWTQYEREIREAMMDCFKAPEACQQVHDATYSREADVSVEKMQNSILEHTGFEVKISKN